MYQHILAQTVIIDAQSCPLSSTIGWTDGEHLFAQHSLHIGDIWEVTRSLSNLCC